MRHQPSIVFAFVAVLLLLSIESYEACRTTNLLLPSPKWRPVTPPKTNPGHNSVGTVSEQNFAASELHRREKSSNNNNVLLPSLKWRKVTPPSSNAVHNAVDTVSEQSYAGGMPKRRWRPVTPPSRNPGHNSIGTVGEQNFAAGLPAEKKSNNLLLPSLRNCV